MGLLKDMVELFRNKPIEEDFKEIEKIEEAGSSDADKIAKKLGQDTKKNFVPRFDITMPPVELPADGPAIADQQKADDGR